MYWRGGGGVYCCWAIVVFNKRYFLPEHFTNCTHFCWFFLRNLNVMVLQLYKWSCMNSKWASSTVKTCLQGTRQHIKVSPHGRCRFITSSLTCGSRDTILNIFFFCRTRSCINSNIYLYSFIYRWYLGPIARFREPTSNFLIKRSSTYTSWQSLQEWKVHALPTDVWLRHHFVARYEDILHSFVPDISCFQREILLSHNTRKYRHVWLRSWF